MEISELQSNPLNLRMVPLKLSILDTTSSCFYGSIEKLSLLKVAVMGIFIIIEANKYSFPYDGITYIKPFYYDSPKHEFKEKDCPSATHFLVTGNLDVSYEDYKSFLNSLYSADIYKKLDEKFAKPIY